MDENMQYQVPSNGAAQRRTYKTGTSYLAMIAHVLQDSPHKMLTFTQLMEKLEALVSRDRKGLKNNIRVCLSSNDCFVKVPVRTDEPIKPHSKKNYWRVDQSRITEKMMRRHFKGTLDQFPGLSPKMKMEKGQADPCVKVCSPKSAAPLSQNNEKFSSPFSIESLLKRESFTPGRRLSPLSVVSSAPVREQQQPWRAERAVGTKRWLSWDCEPGETHRVSSGHCYSMYTTQGDTDRGLIGESSRPFIFNRVWADPTPLVYTKHNTVSPLLSQRNCYVKYPVSAYAYVAHRFRF